MFRWRWCRHRRSRCLHFFFGRQIIIQEGDEKQLERVGDKWKKKEIYIKSYRERLLRIETTKDAREEEEEEEEEEYA
jgi:hypothetical protein